MGIIRVALYPRVSTEEQALHGYSMEAQEDELVQFAKANNMKIVGIYRDEGYSARKPALKRKVMQELLEDVKAGKIDRIIFIKLDRWFRNVREYHKIQEILEAHNVTWQATMEDYSTATADGRFKVNIMLSVAENEADRTSERVRFIFESKRRKKQLAFGGKIPPFGYKVEAIDGIKRLVKDPETEPIVTDFFDHIRKYNSVRLASLFCNEKYGLTRNYRTWAGTAHRELYTGTYKGVEDYCPAYITHEEWDHLQNDHVLIRKTQSVERVYLFTGMLRCPDCGKTLKATFKTYPRDRSVEYNGYRCNNGQVGICTYKSTVSEKKVEKYLLQNVAGELEAFLSGAELAGRQKKKKLVELDVAKLNEQLRRVNVVFVAGNISDEEYAEQVAEIKRKLEKAKQAEKDERPPDLKILKQFLKSDFASIYATLSKEDKRRMWRSIIEEIYIDGIHPCGIKFRA